MGYGRYALLQRSLRSTRTSIWLLDVSRVPVIFQADIDSLRLLNVTGVVICKSMRSLTGARNDLAVLQASVARVLAGSNSAAACKKRMANMMV